MIDLMIDGNVTVSLREHSSSPQLRPDVTKVPTLCSLGGCESSSRVVVEEEKENNRNHILFSWYQGKEGQKYLEKDEICAICCIGGGHRHFCCSIHAG
jgi:hypothetical protein